MGCPSIYNDKADTFFLRYEAIDAVDIRTLLKHYVRSGQRILELGCGSGRDARFMKSLGADVTATDGSPALLSLAEKREKKEASISRAIEWQTLVLPPSSLSFPQKTSKTFDLIFSSGVFQHLDDHELAETVKALHCWSSEGAVVILLIPLNHPGDAERRTFCREARDYIDLMKTSGFRLIVQEIKSDVGSPGFECHWATLVFQKESDKMPEKSF